MKTRVIRAVALSALAAAAFVAVPFSAVKAQDFKGPVRIVVPFAPGGTSDILARLIGPKLSDAIKTSVIVENKPGAAGNLGAEAVAKAKPDGHTLLLMDVGNLSTAPSLFPDLNFNIQKDLAPIGMVMFGPYVLAVHPSVGVSTPKDLVAYAKANPGKLTVANSGVGAVNHITAIQLAKALGIEWKNVPYKGGAAASRAVISGESNTIINGTTATLPFVVNKQLVGIAVSGEQRLPTAKDLPTFKEAGFPAGDAGTWQGLLTTGGTPAPLVNKLNAELKKILAMPDVQAKIAEQGGVVKAGSPADFAKWLDNSVKTWGGVIKENGLKAQ